VAGSPKVLVPGLSKDKHSEMYAKCSDTSAITIITKHQNSLNKSFERVK